ncbi:hypothetical protein CR513_28848, partial [Mucuna pruriens]
MSIQDDYLDEQLLQMEKITPWFISICNFIIASKFPSEASRLYKEKIESDTKYYIWDDPYLWRLYNDLVIRQPEKCLTVGSTGPPFFKTLINSSSPTSNVRKWVEAAATKTNNTKVVVDFLKSNISYRFGVPKALISDQGSHFYNRAMSSLLEKYGVVHRVATAYHP